MFDTIKSLSQEDFDHLIADLESGELEAQLMEHSQRLIDSLQEASQILAALLAEIENEHHRFMQDTAQ